MRLHYFAVPTIRSAIDRTFDARLAARIIGYAVSLWRVSSWHAAAIASIEQRQTKLPFEIGFGLSTHEDSGGVDADLMIRIRNVGSVAHQPADFRELAARKCHGDRVARRQVDQSGTPTD